MLFYPVNMFIFGKFIILLFFLFLLSDKGPAITAGPLSVIMKLAATSCVASVCKLPNMEKIVVRRIKCNGSVQ